MSYINITVENFQEEVLNSDKPVLIDFWAGWCGPCRMIAPILEDVAKEYAGKIKVAKVNVDEQMELAMQYKVEVIPTLFYFKDGKVIGKTVGVVDKQEIVKNALA